MSHIKCPNCKVASKTIFSGGRYAVCDNYKCYIDKFTVQGFDPSKGEDNGRKNRSYNNSGRR